MLPTDDTLIEALDSADVAVRDLYRKLVDDPGLTPEFEPRLRELLAERLDLASKIGLAVLAQWRASRSAVAKTGEEAAQPEEAEEPPGPETSASELPVADVHEPEHVELPDPEGPETEVADVLPAQPVGEAEVTRWKAAIQSRGFTATLSRGPAAPMPWALVLHELMTLVGPPRDLDNSVAFIDELEALDVVGSPEHQAQWVRLPRDVQQLWLTMLVARTRAMRDNPASGRVREKLKAVRAVYPTWAGKHVPGHVNGLQLKHEPAHGSWVNDGQDAWHALEDRVGHEAPAVAPKGLAKKKERKVESDEEAPGVEDDWPLLTMTEGKTAALIGGEPREPNRRRLETFFRFQTLDWPASDGPRKVEALAQRISRGGYDLVLIIQPLIGHPQAERIIDAAKESATPWAMAESYGPTAVQQGLERFLRST
jgi:hypothetical protein